MIRRIGMTAAAAVASRGLFRVARGSAVNVSRGLGRRARTGVSASRAPTTRWSRVAVWTRPLGTRGLSLSARATAASAGSGAGDASGGTTILPPSPPSPDEVPESTLLFPLLRRPLMPGVMAPIACNDSAFVQVLQERLEAGDDNVGLFLVRDREGDAAQATETTSKYHVDPSQVHDVGILARVVRVDPSALGAHVLLAGRSRIQITSSSPVAQAGEGGFPVVSVRPLFDLDYDRRKDFVKANTVEIVRTLREMLQSNAMFKEQLQSLVDQVDITNPAELADFAACLTTSEAGDLQEVLEALDIEDRLRKALTLIKSELELTKLQKNIQQQLEQSISENQRKYWLQEQLRLIRQELGQVTDEKEALVGKFKERLEALKVPGKTMEVIEEELGKLGSLEPSSSEFNVTRNYLDWLTQLPWGVHKKENFDIDRAEQILDADHYGLKDIKERILEMIAVGALKGVGQGKILCFVGPPGVGKTSIGKSIARALGRDFYRFSVGGMNDVAEIKGHRRTYVGAMPGKLVQCLKSVGSSNPVVLVDELDKLGTSYKSDPSAALLEALDPEQNGEFLDHYLDTPFDLSKVLFVGTANSIDTIPGPLLDRMEVLRLSGYVLEEKVAIAERYLLRVAYESSGLPEGAVDLSTDAIRRLISDYCREAGVRNLEKHIEKIFRKAAFKLVQETHGHPEALFETVVDSSAKEAGEAADEDDASAEDDAAGAPKRLSSKYKPVQVSPDDLETYVGKPVFTSDRFYDTTPPGVVMGLAWTSMGGATLYIESVGYHSDKPGFQITGMMGDVMKESTSIAMTVAKNYLTEHLGDAKAREVLDTQQLHMHIPEGATPKDGPSAGCTMVTSLLSLALDQPVQEKLAMTGEISLTGKILPIGGVKEKTLAARRNKVTTLVFPKANRKDWDELEDYVKEGLDAHFVEHYDEVYALAFPSAHTAVE